MNGRLIKDGYIRNTSWIRLLTAILVLAMFEVSGRGQDLSNYLLQTGAPVFTTSDSLPAGLGFINVANGNAHIEIPLGSYPQRGERPPYSARLIYDSRRFYASGNAVPPGWLIDGSHENINGGWSIRTTEDIGTTSTSAQLFNNNGTCNKDYTVYDTFKWYGTDGVWHYFPFTLVADHGCGHPNTLSGDAISVDGSGSHMFGTLTPGSTQQTDQISVTVYTKDGRVISGSAAQPNGVFKDPNGNFTTGQILNGVVPNDTLGRQPVTMTLSPSMQPPFWFLPPPVDFNIRNSTTSYASVAAQWNLVHLHTNFAVSGFAEFDAYNYVLESLTLPNGTTYQFSYDCDSSTGVAACGSPAGQTGYYGSLRRITLPQAGVVNLGYSNFKDANGNTNRWVASRTSGGGTWSYAPAIGCGTGCQTVTVTRPSGDQEVYSFTVSNPSGAWNTAVKSYSGSATGTPVMTAQTNYASYPADSFFGSSAFIHPTSTTITLSGPTGNLVKQTNFTFDTFTYVYHGVSYTGTAGKLLTKNELAFGNGSPGLPIRTTSFTYWDDAHTSYKNVNLINLPMDIQVKDGSGMVKAETKISYDSPPLASVTGIVNHDDNLYGVGNLTRGNPTLIQRWTGSAWLNTTLTYDTTGQLVSAADPKGNPTTLTYDPAFAHAYITKLTNALNQNSSFGYDFNTGLLTSTIDLNSKTTSFSYDLMNRPVRTIERDGGGTWIDYTSSTQSDVFTGLTQAPASGCTGCRHDIITSDGFGRISQTQDASDPAGSDYANATYDTTGRLASVSNPHRSVVGATDGTTTFAYEGLDRPKSTTYADGSVARTLYGADMAAQGGRTNQLCSTATYGIGYPRLTIDEAGRKRQTWTDALGNIIEVDEPADTTNSPSVQTCYLNDILGNVTQVLQNGSRQRNFVYDALSRLTSETNPESGTRTYTYDNNGNVLTVRDARNITTTYTYDALNRITQKSYSDGTLTGYYNYDAAPTWMPDLTNTVGRLTVMNNSSAGLSDGRATSTTYSYDTMGRILRTWQQTPSIAPGASFVYQTYNLVGNLTSATNAPGVVISYTYDTASRLKMITSSWNDAAHPPTLYSIDPTVGYFPNGALRKATLPSGLTETAMYNNRLQPCRMEINSTAASFTSCTGAVPGGNFLDFTYGYNSGTSNNGNVASWSSVGNQTFSRSYSYDWLNRLKTFSDTATAQACKGLSWTYDAWGNRTQQTSTAGTCGQLQAGVNSKNQLTDPVNNLYQYDAAGNMIHDASHSYAYDAENRLIQVDAGATASYLYDPNGNRVTKKSAGSWTDYYYDSFGNVTAEHNPTSWPAEYVYAGGQLIAQYTSSNTYFIFKDHLGSARLITTPNKSVCIPLDFMPFGEQLTGGICTTHKFTGQEHDAESGLDNFAARYISSSLGRFMGPDPLRGYSEDPQSLNAYSYVLNSPPNYVDPSGMDPIVLQYWGYSNDSFGGPGLGSFGGTNVGGGYSGGFSTGAAFWTPHGYNPCALGGCDRGPSMAAAFSPPSGGFSSFGASTGMFGDPSSYGSYTFDDFLKQASDFSAGAGDCLTGRCVPFVHSSLTELARRRNGADSVVDKNSGAYLGGEITGSVVGSTLLSAIGATGGAVANGKNGALFGRGGRAFFNRGPVRFGWGWEGSAKAGRDVIRLGIGAARGTSWWSHIPFYYP